MNHINNMESFDFKKSVRSLVDFNIYESSSIIEGLIDEKSLMLVFAPSGGQKSLFCLDMAIAIASGREFLGFKSSSRNVLYVDGEMSEFTVSKRHKIFNEPKLTQYELGYICTSLDDSTGGIDFSKKNQREDFLKFLLESDYEVVFLDNLRTLYALRDENSASEVDPFNRFIKLLRNNGMTVIVVHHSNKNKDSLDYAGSSNISTVFNTIVGLGEGALKNSRTLQIMKNRDSDELSELQDQIVLLKDGKYEIYDYEDIDLEESANRILDFINAGDVSIGKVRSFIRNELQMTVSSQKSKSWEAIYDTFIKGFSSRTEADTYECFKRFINSAKRGTKSKILSVEQSSAEEPWEEITF